MQVGLGPGHVVLDGDPAPPPPKGQSPQFSVHICCGQMARWIKMPHSREVDLSRSEFVLDRDPAPSPKRGQSHLPNFRPCLLWPNDWMHQDATWYGGRPRPRRHCFRWRHSSPSPRRGGAPSPIFGPCQLCQTAGWIKMALGMEVGLGDILRFGKLSRIEIVYYTILRTLVSESRPMTSRK